MADFKALAAFTHPTNKTKALLFYNTQESTLALQLPSATTNKIITYENTDAVVTGDISKPTSFAALYLDNADTALIGVYGVITVPNTVLNTVPECVSGTNNNDGATTTNNGRLCLLSPAFMPLEDSTQFANAVKHGRLAGVQALGLTGAGSLYYSRSADSGVGIQISRLDISEKMSTDVEHAYSASEETFLAAYYDVTKKERHVLYQINGTPDQVKSIFDLNDDGSSAAVNVNLKDAQPPAGMAAVWVKDKAYLYYVANKSSTQCQLHRLVKDTVTGSWDMKPTSLITKNNLLNTTQLTVTALEKRNYIAYYNDSGVMETFEDDYE